MYKLPKFRNRLKMLTRIYFLIIILGAASLASCMVDPEEKAITQNRSERDAWFKYSEHSPLNKEQRNRFSGLDYFTYNTDMRIPARLIRDEKPNDIDVKSDTGFDAVFKGIGFVEFMHKGHSYRLAAYHPPRFMASVDQGNILFIPFGDATNGETTFSIGRYLDIPMPESEDHILDFNKAYNPFCAYNETYLCPGPPEKNVLPFSVKAGEKKFE